MREPSFYEAPSCATVGGDFWFVEPTFEGGSTVDASYAKSICSRCPHQRECAEWGIKNETHGIWGGLAPKDRSKVRSQRSIKIHEEDKSA